MSFEIYGVFVHMTNSTRPRSTSSVTDTEFKVQFTTVTCQLCDYSTKREHDIQLLTLDQCAFPKRSAETIKIMTTGLHSDHDQPGFWEAIEAGNYSMVLDILDRNDEIQLDNLDPGGCTALGIAALRGNLDLVRLLLQRGASVNHSDFYGQTPLHYAAEIGSRTLGECLLKAGADVNWSCLGGEGLTALHVAACKGRYDVTKTLIESGGDVNGKDNNGVTVLHCAVANGFIDVTECLLAYGSNPNASGLTTGRTPIFLACEIQHLDIVRLLVKNGARVNITDHYGMSPLCIACLQNQTDLAGFLLESGSRLNSVDHRGNTALFYSARNGNETLIALLLQKGHPVNTVNSDGITPLHIAIQMRQTAVAKILLQNGANPNTTNPPLLGAVRSYEDPNEFQSLLKELLCYSANIDQIDDHTGMSALYTALHLKKAEISQCLIQHGASVNVECPMDQTVLYKACQRGMTPTAELIICADIQWNREMWLHTDIHASGINPKLLLGYAEDVPMILLKNVDLFQQILSRRFNAQSLGFLCRVLIRRRLGECLWRNVEKLGLPRSLKEYLMMRVV